MKAGEVHVQTEPYRIKKYEHYIRHLVKKSSVGKKYIFDALKGALSRVFLDFDISP